MDYSKNLCSDRDRTESYIKGEPRRRCCETKSILKANFSEKWNEIYKKLLELEDTFPYKYEELRESELMNLGIDIGIDPMGNLYIFEANGAPDTSNLRAEAANYRSMYYKYLLEQVNIGKE